MKIIPYLNFEGNTEEVMKTYQQIFNGTISDLNRFGEHAHGEENKDKIMHAQLHFDGNTLMFSDAMPGWGVVHGNGINLSIGLSDEIKARSIYDQLAEGGKATMPMERQFWGALFGMVIDKFGVSWMINCE